MKKSLLLILLSASLHIQASSSEAPTQEMYDALRTMDLPVYETPNHGAFTLGHYIVMMNAMSNDMGAPETKYEKVLHKELNHYTKTGDGLKGPILVEVKGKNKHGNLHVQYTYDEIVVRLVMQYDGDFIGYSFDDVSMRAKNNKWKFNPEGDILQAIMIAKRFGNEIMYIENDEYTF